MTLFEISKEDLLEAGGSGAAQPFVVNRTDDSFAAALSVFNSSWESSVDNHRAKACSSRTSRANPDNDEAAAGQSGFNRSVDNPCAKAGSSGTSGVNHAEGSSVETSNEHGRHTLASAAVEDVSTHLMKNEKQFTVRLLMYRTTTAYKMAKYRTTTGGRIQKMMRKRNATSITTTVTPLVTRVHLLLLVCRPRPLVGKHQGDSSLGARGNVWKHKRRHRLEKSITSVHANV